MAHRAHGLMLPTRIDGRSLGKATNHRLRPHLVSSTFDSAVPTRSRVTAAKGQEETLSAICTAGRKPGVIVTDRDARTPLADDGASGEPHRDR